MHLLWSNQSNIIQGHYSRKSRRTGWTGNVVWQNVHSNGEQCLFTTFGPELTAQVATECLSSLFSRSLIDDTDFQSIVCPMYHEQTVNELRRILQSIQVDPEDIDEDQYLYLKRFSEVIRCFH